MPETNLETKYSMLKNICSSFSSHCLDLCLCLLSLCLSAYLSLPFFLLRLRIQCRTLNVPGKHSNTDNIHTISRTFPFYWDIVSTMYHKLVLNAESSFLHEEYVVTHASFFYWAKEAMKMVIIRQGDESCLNSLQKYGRIYLLTMNLKFQSLHWG